MKELMNELLGLMAKNNSVEVERFTAQLLSEVFEKPMFNSEWEKDPRREAIVFALTYLFVKPDDMDFVNIADIFEFMTKTEAFIEYTHFIETSEGLTGLIRLYNEIAHNHHVECETPDTLIGGFMEFTQMNNFRNPMWDTISNFFTEQDTEYGIEISDPEETYQRVIASEDPFGEGFAKEWE